MTASFCRSPAVPSAAPSFSGFPAIKAAAPALHTAVQTLSVPTWPSFGEPQTTATFPGLTTVWERAD